MADDLPHLLDLPVGLDATGTRTESDSLGEVRVPADRYWGAQTQRALEHFALLDPMPADLIHAYGLLKAAAATVNARDGRIAAWKGDLIVRVAHEVASGGLDDHFPLPVWQSGSGTQTNMNLNEVIANRCIQLVGGRLGSKAPVHPNDDVNMGQSTNDTFIAAMHVAAVEAASRRTIPALRALRDAADAKAGEWVDVVKVGRTHLEDAVPLTVGQEWSGYVAALDQAIAEVQRTSDGLLALAVGGTAVGTGLNAPEGFGGEVAAELAALTGHAFAVADNHFAALSTIDAVVRAHGALKAAAVTLHKMANDLRWLGSGPRAGLHELELPANEPGSSIMPGKVNPTQAEALMMACIEVMGADVTVSMAGAGGNLQLNTLRPVVAMAHLHSLDLLAGVVEGFRVHQIEGLRLDRTRIAEDVARSVMPVTALAPVIGYDRAAAIAHRAVAGNLSLREAAVLDGVDPELFDRVVDLQAMTRPGIQAE